MCKSGGRTAVGIGNTAAAYVLRPWKPDVCVPSHGPRKSITGVVGAVAMGTLSLTYGVDGCALPGTALEYHLAIS